MSDPVTERRSTEAAEGASCCIDLRGLLSLALLVAIYESALVSIFLNRHASPLAAGLLMFFVIWFGYTMLLIGIEQNLLGEIAGLFKRRSVNIRVPDAANRFIAGLVVAVAVVTAFYLAIWQEER